MMSFRSLTLASLSSAALAMPMTAAAQTDQQQKELAQALGNFTTAQRVLGMNESCEVLEADAQRYAELMVSEMKGPLTRALRDKFDPDAIHEAGRDALEGCKSRKDAPKAWAEIDAARETGAAFTVAASLISVNPDNCLKSPSGRVSTEQFKAAADITMAGRAKGEQTALTASARNIAKVLEAECKNPQFFYPRTFRPAVAKVGALQRLRQTESGRTNSALIAVGQEKSDKIDPWIGPWRSSFQLSPSGTANRSVTAYRAYGESRSVARFGLRSGATFSGNGQMYFSRNGVIEARINGDFDSVVLMSVNSSKFYTLTRQNKDVKPDFFGETPAEFTMIKADRDRMLTENDETSNFHILYRPTPKANLKPFMNGQTGDRGIVNLGDLVRAFRWATAPSAL